MAKYTNSKVFNSSNAKNIFKDEQVNYKKVNHDNDNDDISSCNSTLPIDPNQLLVNSISHNLYRLAIKQTHEGRYQKKIRRENKKYPTLIERQTILTKKKPIKSHDVDRLFEEKRLRPLTMKSDLMELYQKSTTRVRSMLDIRQIDNFIQTTENRKKHRTHVE